MQRPRVQLRMRHLLGLVAAFAGLFAVLRYRQEVYDPASAQARRLRALDPAERIEAVGKLAAMGPEAESAIPSLLGALNDGDPRVRARAAMATTFVLRASDDPRADDVRAALTAALADPGARHAAAVALGMLQPDPKAILPALIEAAGDADTEVRARAVGVLGFALDDEGAWSTVLRATRDRHHRRPQPGDPSPRMEAQAGAARRRPRGPAPALKEPNEVIRGFAAETLGRYAQLVPGDVPELYDALSDPNPFVRRMVCEFLPYRPAQAGRADPGPVPGRPRAGGPSRRGLAARIDRPRRRDGPHRPPPRDRGQGRDGPRRRLRGRPTDRVQGD